MRIAFLVTYLLGIGHLARTARAADAFAAAGHDALVISGGMPAPLASVKTAEFHQLTPVRSDTTFTKLFDAEGEIASDALLASRIEDIGRQIDAFAPDVLVTELFPLGRRKLAGEFEAALRMADGALTLAALRDILQLPYKPGRKEEAEAYLDQYYHGILFHGDSGLIGLSDSWSLPPSLDIPILETGYIGSSVVEPADGNDGTGEIIVAAGSSGVGNALFRSAVEAAARRPDTRWRLLIGGADPATRIAGLGTLPPNLIAERTRPDFRAMLTRCDAAILQCGYNTAMDVIATGVRAVFCPFEEGGETEQLQRARAMAARFNSSVVREQDLSAPALLTAIDSCITAPRPDFSGLKLDGATRSVELVEATLAARR